MKPDKTLLFSLFVIISILLISCKEENEPLRKSIQTIIEKTDGTVGVAIKNLETDDTLSFNNGHKFPMQSVYKFPLSITVLSKVDKSELKLDQKIHISKTDLLPNTWSPLREKYPEGNVDITLSEIISYTVSQSDNNGCDILFRLIGGTEVANDFIREFGITEISIKGTEEEMHKDWNVQFKNWCKPTAMVNLLEKFYGQEILKDSTNDFLWKQMVETTTGPKRLKGLLPEGTTVAHKTGSSGKNEGLSAAVNDVGIIILPNGQHVAIAIFISNSKAEDEVSEKAIAEIAKVVYDYYK